jgi:hypothetical protein
LGRFIKESRFTVPSHQRDYSWTKEYVQEFIRDIEDAFAAKRESYFCGLMVFTQLSPGVFKVLDGQQRLATTLMLYSAVRNWLAPFSDFKKTHYLVDDYLGSTELGAQQREPRLTLAPANNNAFQQYVTSSVPLAQMERALTKKMIDNRSETLAKAAIIINRHIESKADSITPEEAKDYFVSILKYISDNVQIVRFVLSTDDAAYTIFETLNDRGLELAPLDLVKNYLFSKAEKYRKGSLPEFEERWAEMMALLSSSRADSFLRAFWSSKHGKPEGAKLFGAFKRTYTESDALYGLSVDMRRDAERYAALFNSRDAIWAEYSARARSSVDALSTIGFSQAYPIILSALEKFKKAEIERLLWLIECVAVRHQLIGRKRPGRVESLGGRAAKDISEGKLTSATGVLGVVRELYVPDEEFKLAFETNEEASGKKIRYLLAGIERETVARDNQTLRDELTPHAVTVEHIFPSSPSAEWRATVEADKEWDDRFISRLGNLCLLPGINHALGNKPFPEKTKIYEQSLLKTTKSVAQFGMWGREQIIERQKRMAKLAVTAWHFQ